MKILKLLFIASLTLLLGTNSFAGILFEDDFESGEIDTSKWAPPANWQVIDNEDGPDVLGQFVLDAPGGEEGLSEVELPEEYDYYADFRAMENSLAGFIFHGQDTNNIYMHQVSVGGSNWTPQHIRWHRKVAGGYVAEPEPFVDGIDREQGVWYRAKFEVRGFNFKAYIGDVGTDNLSLVSEWTDSEEAFNKGKVGFRLSGAEHAQFDNVIVVTPGTSILAVDPQEKLPLTWGVLKTQ